MIQFSHTIIYVDNVQKALDFYTNTFGCKVLFIHESGAYGELDTGSTKLAFAEKGFIEMNHKIETAKTKEVHAFEICFTTSDVEETYAHAVEKGANPIKKPEAMPWGQTIAYVQDPANGTLIEIGGEITS